MTLPDEDPPRNPPETEVEGRARHRWLFGPYILLLLLAIVWSGGWVWLKLGALRQIDQSAASLRTAGYQVAWASREVGGYPFRLRARLVDVRIAEPSGWGLAAPELKAEAAIYALGRWTLAAQQGVVLTRPREGAVTIRGELLRASVSDLDRRPPNIVVEGRKLIFTPQTGAAPYQLSTADRLDFNLRPGPDDQVAVLLRVENATANLTGLLGRVAGGRPVSMNWESILDHMSGFKGRDWPSSVQAWTAAGGAIRVRNASLTAGEAQASAKSGALTVGPDGRLRGALQAELREVSPAQPGSPPPMTGAAQAVIAFEDGETLLGPLPVGPAPSVY